MAKNYINELLEENLLVTMENDFQKDYPDLVAQFRIPSIPTRIRMIFTTRNYEFAGYFVTTNFDVKKEDKPQNYQFLQNAESGVDLKSIKKWYVKWMKNHFDTYKEDFIAYKTRELENEFDI